MRGIQVRMVGATDVGLVREHNEDSFLLVDLDRATTDPEALRDFSLGPRGALLVVCDGMGGAAAGEVASAMAVGGMRRILSETLYPEPEEHAPGDAGGAAEAGEGSAPAEPPATAGPTGAPPSLANLPTDKLKPLRPEGDVDPVVRDLARRLRDAAHAVNQEIFEAACADMAKAGMGTTLTALLLRRGRVLVAQVGDSRAYLLRQGRLTQITHDQSLVNSLLDSGQITPEQARLFEHSNVILQALGVQEDVEVLLSTEELRRGDRILLCSDGLVGVVSDEEIQEALAQGGSLEEQCRTLIDMARTAGGPDNITVIVAEVDGEALRLPTESDGVAYRALLLEDAATRRLQRRDRSLHDALPAPAAPAPLSLGATLSMAWVVGLLVAGLVVGLLLYPAQLPARRPMQGALCYFMADVPGMEILIDGELADRLGNPGTELRVSPGLHRVVLRDHAGVGEEQWIQVSPGQRCAYRLRPPRREGAR